MTQDHDSEIGDDGLTDNERAILQTPVSQVPPEQRHILVALRDKKSNYIYAENERLRAEEKKARQEKEKREIEADKAKHAKKEKSHA